MPTLETDVEIQADGSVKLLSPLPAWLKPGRAHVRLTVTASEDNPNAPERLGPQASPEMIARRMAAFEELRALDPYREIADPVEWQREIRKDVARPGRE